MGVAIRTQGDVMRSTLAQVAPGTELGDGLERILLGRTGALIVLGYDKTVENLCTGGFEIGIEFSPTRLRELAKMDGAIILDREAKHILRAAVQLVPDPTIETEESGTRHRTAERVAKQTGLPVISVSQSMNTIALYVGTTRHVLEDPESIMARANQAIQTMERYRERLDTVTQTLSALEIEANVSVKDVSLALQREEMVRRISEEIDQYVLELGVDGRLISLQLEELKAGLGEGTELIIRDYADVDASSKAAEASIEARIEELHNLNSAELLDLNAIAHIVAFPEGSGSLDSLVQPRGYRLLAAIKAMPPVVSNRLVEHFGRLQSLMAANIDDLMEVDQIGEQRARTVREGLSRMAETSLLENYR